MTEPITVFICRRGQNHRCATSGCDGTSIALCDFPLTGAKAGQTCSRRMCAKCKRTQRPPSFGGDGHDGIDYCPAHDRLARERLEKYAKIDEVSEATYDKILDLVANPPEPTEALKKLLREK